MEDKSNGNRISGPQPELRSHRATDVPTYPLRADVREHRNTLYGMLRAARELDHELRLGLEDAWLEFEIYCAAIGEPTL